MTGYEKANEMTEQPPTHHYSAPYPQPQPAPPAYYYPQPQSTNGLAIASMVLGIVWVWWLGSILAVIFGHVALSQIGRSGAKGRGMAIAGIVLGWVGVATLLLVIVSVAAGS